MTKSRHSKGDYILEYRAAIVHKYFIKFKSKTFRTYKIHYTSQHLLFWYEEWK